MDRCWINKYLDKIYRSVKMNFQVSFHKGRGGGRLHLRPQKFENIFVAVIIFPPFFCADTFDNQLVAYCVCFKMICKKSL